MSEESQDTSEETFPPDASETDSSASGDSEEQPPFGDPPGSDEEESTSTDESAADESFHEPDDEPDTDASEDSPDRDSTPIELSNTIDEESPSEETTESESEEPSGEPTRETPDPTAEAESSEDLDSSERRFREQMAAEIGPDDEDGLDPENLIGETLDDRYHIEECIGQGGMGVVYRAHQEGLDREIVVKVLPESFVDDSEARARFRREARGMSKLEHPHVVSTYDFGQDMGRAYICMEYVEGHTLADRVSEEPLPLEDFCPIAVQILQGLGDAHEMGMVHRDVKPSNIMLCERRGFENYVKLLDFGLAKLLKGTTEVTGEQKLVGSVSFLSPEQITGKAIDERVDVYSLGVLFYYMLSGKKPFTADEDVRVLYQHVHESPPFLFKEMPSGTEVPDRLIELIHRCLSKKPENRPDNANVLLSEFTAAAPSQLIRLPWSTGEFNAMSRSQIDTDSPRQALTPPESMTPPEGVSSAATGPGVGETTPPGASERTDPTKVEGTPTGHEEPSFDDRSQPALSKLPLFLAGLFVVGGLGILAVLLTGSEDQTEVAAVPSDASSSEASGATSGAVAAGDDAAEDEKAAERAAVRVAPSPGGTVTIDGEAIGDAPVEQRLKPGEHQVVIEADGYETWESTIDVEAGDELDVTPDLVEQPRKPAAAKPSGSQPAAGSSPPSRSGRGGGSPRSGSASESESGTTPSRGSSSPTRSGGRAAQDEKEPTSDSPTAGTPGSGETQQQQAANADKPSAESKGSESSPSRGSAEEAGESAPKEPSDEKQNSSDDGDVPLLPAEDSDEKSSDEQKEPGGLLPVD